VEPTFGQKGTPDRQNSVEFRHHTDDRDAGLSFPLAKCLNDRVLPRRKEFLDPGFIHNDRKEQADLMSKAQPTDLSYPTGHSHWYFLVTSTASQGLTRTPAEDVTMTPWKRYDSLLRAAGSSQIQA